MRSDEEVASDEWKRFKSSRLKSSGEAKREAARCPRYRKAKADPSASGRRRLRPEGRDDKWFAGRDGEEGFLAPLGVTGVGAQQCCAPKGGEEGGGATRRYKKREPARCRRYKNKGTIYRAPTGMKEQRGARRQNDPGDALKRGPTITTSKKLPRIEISDRMLRVRGSCREHIFRY